MFKVVLAPRADKEFERLPKKLQQKFFEEFKKLSSHPFALLNVKKIKNTKFGYRLRVGRWRILFALFPNEKRIEIVDIFLKKGREDYFKKRGSIK